jgi:hypothetical protein
MGNPWLEHVAKFRKSHPALSYKQVLEQARGTYKKAKVVKAVVKSGSKSAIKIGKGAKTKRVTLKSGGNALAGAVAVGETVDKLTNSLGNQIDKGRRTTQEINEKTGYTEVEKKRNKGNEEREFQAFYRDLVHQRYWDPEKLPPRLRLPFDRKNINNPKYKSQREAADEKLYAYAEKVFGRA